jgi:(2Fe-2S) ferredoxin
MGKVCLEPISEFCLEGRFIDFVIKDGYKLKGLILETSEGQCYVKLAKHLRCTFDWRLAPQTKLQIVGTKKLCSKTGEYKLKAERVMAARANGEEYISPPQPNEPTKSKPAKQTTILMCQKSDCMKLGGKALCQTLHKELQARNLDSEVIIKPTGCMKNCKGGPNLVMPDKTRYSRIQAKDVPALLDKYFPISAKTKTSDKQPNPVITVLRTLV